MSVSYDFAGRVAVVTGGASGIGRRIAERLRDAGSRVIVWDRRAGGGLEDIGSVTLDVTDGAAIAAATRAVVERHGTIDILIHSAGYVGPSESVVRYDPVEWRRLIDVNLVGTYEVCRHVVPVMQAADGGKGAGRIVTIASLAGKEGTPNSSAYSAAKAGVIAFTKALGKELANTAIRVNTVAPAAVETELLAQVSAEHLATMIAKSPMGRLGTVDEVAEQVLWLASEACTFSTGAVFDLSGGRATY
ncbi:MAG: SDR family NAD(P)-dependent oxidoreductase [Hyphomicrobiaceae bacterium]